MSCQAEETAHVNAQRSEKAQPFTNSTLRLARAVNDAIERGRRRDPRINKTLLCSLCLAITIWLGMR